MKLQKVYHMGIPVDDLDRARDFYTNILGMEYLGRVGGNRGYDSGMLMKSRRRWLVDCARTWKLRAITVASGSTSRNR